MLHSCILPLISFVFVFVLGIIVILKNRKANLNLIFFLFSVCVAVWLFGTFMMFVNSEDAWVIFWDKIAYIGVVFIPVTSYHFGLLFSKRKKNKVLLWMGYILSFAFLLLIPTKYFIDDIFRYNWGCHTQAQFLHHPFLVFFAFYVFLFFYTIYRYQQSISGLEKTQARYVFIALLFLSVGSISFFPAYGVDIYPLTYLSYLAGVFCVSILAYAIIKYRLMDIRFVIKRSTIFSGMVIIIMATYALAAFLFSWTVFGDVYTFKSQVWTGLFVAVLISFGFIPLYNWLKKTTDTFLFKGDYNPQKVLADISDILSQTLDLDKVVNVLEEKVSAALRLKKMDVIILKDKDFLGQKKGPEIKIKNVLKKTIAYYKKQKDVLVLDELKRKRADKIKFEKSFDLIEDLEKLKTSLVVPLKLKEKLVGLFILDAKKSGDMFTNEDIQVLETIASQAAVAIENAWLYEEMKGFSKTLQEEVNRQTKELKDANVKLKQLDEAKSEFISLASHQLRTPLSIIKGYVSMILEGVWGNTNKEQKNYLEKVYSSNERLIKLVEDLLTVSRIESGRLDFDLQSVAIDQLTESIVADSQPIAIKKGIYLKYVKPKKSLPMVKADSLKIRQVIQNLIDNSIHYTKKGGVTVSIKKEDKKIIFSIQDTGIGISSKDKGVLFEKFSRGEGISKLNTEGTGLGLYLAAKLIKAHKGKIWVKSEGKGKGSAFYFELPV